MSAWRVLRRAVRLLGLIVWALRNGDARHLAELGASPPAPAAGARVRDWYRRVLDGIGVRVTVRGEWADGPCLVVGNHVSWLDILVLGSALPIVFLSKSEIGRWPVISRLARAGGTLFIARGRIGAARRSIDEIRRALGRGQSVLVFPEGTTGDGRRVGRFYSRLFAAAIESGSRVQPVALRYPHPAGTHPKARYTGDDLLLPSVLRVLGSRDLTAEVRIGPPLAAAGRERRALAEAARAFVAGAVEDAAGGLSSGS